MVTTIGDLFKNVKQYFNTLYFNDLYKKSSKELKDRQDKIPTPYHPQLVERYYEQKYKNELEKKKKLIDMIL